MLPDDLPRGAFALLQVLIVDNNNLTGLVVPSVLSGMGVGSASQQPETSNSSAFNAIGNNSTPETVSAVPTRYYRPPGNWKELRIFSAANNALTVIPPETCNWNKLTTLNLRNNKLKVLPGPLLRQWAATLIKLSVGSNNISLCPEDVGICKQLKELDMS